MSGADIVDVRGTLLPGLFDCMCTWSPTEPGSLERVGDMDDDQIDAVMDRRSLSRRLPGSPRSATWATRLRTLAFRDRAAPGVPRIVAAGPPLTYGPGTATTWAVRSTARPQSGPQC